MENTNYYNISVCIPSYNYAHFLAGAIESVLNQSYKYFELIVIDNCSTDNTKEIVQKYLEIDQRVKYLCNETNVGLVRNFSRRVT